MSPRSAHVELELLVATEPIGGTVRHDREREARPFTGWLELAALLDSARQATHTMPHDEAPTEGGPRV